MGNRRGQVSVEFSAVLAVQLLILALLMVIFGGIIAQMGIRSQYIVSRDSVQLVAHTSQIVWNEGAGSSRRIMLSLPPTVVLNASYIGNNTIDLYMLSFGDTTAAVPFPIYGDWPALRGSSEVDIANNGSAVIVSPALYLPANTSSIYAPINWTTSKTYAYTVQFANFMNETYNISPSANPCSPSISCVVSPSAMQSVAAGATKEFTITLDSTPLAPGLYSGHINFSLVSALRTPLAPNATYTIPITARVFT